MIIKAKYPSLERPYMRTVNQGFGSLYGGNQVSDVVNEDRLEDIINTSNDSMFEGSRLFTYVNPNTGQELVFTNESIFLINESDSIVTELNSLRELETINESDWAPATPIFQVLSENGFYLVTENNQNIITQ